MNILMTSIVDLKKSQHNRPHEFVKYLSKNHHLTVLSINDWWKHSKNETGYDNELCYDDWGNVDFNYLTDKKISPFLQEVLFSRKIKNLSKESFDVHLNYNSLLTGYNASKKIKTVFDIADDLSEMIKFSPQIPRILRPIGKHLGDLYLKKNIENAEAVALTTHTLVDTYHIPAEKYKIISNGVDIETFNYVKKAKEILKLENFILGYVGVLREWVDFKPVFKALRNLNNNIKLLIVGNEGDLEHHKYLAKKYDVYNKVIFTGLVPYHQVPLYISAMDICLIPFGANEIAGNALPLKLFEYMACKRPIISTEIKPIKKIVGNTVLYSNNTKDYVKNINILYENPNLRKKLGKEGRKIVEKEYDWKVIVNELEKILIKVKG